MLQILEQAEDPKALKNNYLSLKAGNTINIPFPKSVYIKALTDIKNQVVSFKTNMNDFAGLVDSEIIGKITASRETAKIKSEFKRLKDKALNQLKIDFNDLNIQLFFSKEILLTFP